MDKMTQNQLEAELAAVKAERDRLREACEYAISDPAALAYLYPKKYAAKRLDSINATLRDALAAGGRP